MEVFNCKFVDTEDMAATYDAALKLHKNHGKDNLAFFVLCYALESWFMDRDIKPIISIVFEPENSLFNRVASILEEVTDGMA